MKQRKRRGEAEYKAWQTFLYLTDNDRFPQWERNLEHVNKVRKLSSELFGVKLKKSSEIYSAETDGKRTVYATDVFSEMANFLRISSKQLQKAFEPCMDRQINSVRIGKYWVTREVEEQ